MDIPWFGKWQKPWMLGAEWDEKVCRFALASRSENGRWFLQKVLRLDLSDSLEEQIRFLEETLRQNGWKGCPAAVSLQHPTLHLRRLELPKMPADDLREAIRWQMRDVAEGSIDDYLVRYSVLEEISTPLPRLVVLGFVIKKQAVREKTQNIVRVGLKPVFMEPLPVSLATFLEEAHPSKGEWTAGLWLGKTQVYFFVVGRNRLHFVRSLSALLPVQPLEREENFLGKVAVEVQNALDAFSIVYRDESIRRLFLMKNGGEPPFLANYLTKTLGVRAEDFRGWNGWGISEEARKTLEAEAADFMPAVSMVRAAS